MTIADKTALPQGNVLGADQAKQFPVLNVLKRLSTGESLNTIMSGTGLNESELRACFRVAYDVVLKTSGSDPGDSVADWRKMSVADALDVLAAHACKQHKRD